VVALVDDLGRVGLAHELLVKTEVVWGLSVRNLVSTVPLADRIKHTWELLFHVVNVVQVRCPLVFRIDNNNLPVAFTFVDHAEDTKNRNRADVTGLDDTGADLANIERVIVATASLRIGVDEGWVFPGLREATVVEEDITLLELKRKLK